MRLSKDLSVGHPFKVMALFSLPMLISVVFQQIYNIADSMIAGSYAGEDALASIGAAFPVTMLLMSICFGCNIACSIVTSRLYGAKQFDRFCAAVKTSLSTSLICAIVLTVVGIVFSEPILRLINTPENIFDGSKTYLDIYVYGFLFLFIYNIANGIFNSMGDSITPLIFLIGSSVANIVLDIIFVRDFKMGVAGAAWATFIAQGIAGLLSLIVLIYKIYKAYKIEFKAAKWFTRSLFDDFVRMAIPSILQQLTVSVGTLIMQVFVNDFPSSIGAGYTSATKLNAFPLVSAVTLGNAMSTYTGQNVGAGKQSRVKEGVRYNVLMNILLVALFSLAYFFVPRSLVQLFMNEDTSEQAIKTGVEFLRIVSPFYLFMAIKLTLDGTLRGLGHMKSFILSTFLDLVLRIVFAAVLINFVAERGIWIAWPIGWVIGATVTFLLYKRAVKNITSQSPHKSGNGQTP